VPAEHVDEVLSRAGAAGVPARAIGTTGGRRIRIRLDGAVAIDVDVYEAELAWQMGLERYLARQVA